MKRFMSMALCALSFILFSSFTIMDTPVEGADPERGTSESSGSGSAVFYCDGNPFYADYEFTSTTHWVRVLADDGSYHYTGHTTLRGVLMNADGKWILIEGNRISIKYDPKGGEADAVTRTSMTRFIGQGDLPDLRVNFRSHRTFDASGRLRVAHQMYDFSCE